MLKSASTEGPESGSKHQSFDTPCQLLKIFACQPSHQRIGLFKRLVLWEVWNVEELVLLHPRGPSVCASTRNSRWTGASSTRRCTKPCWPGGTYSWRPAEAETSAEQLLQEDKCRRNSSDSSTWRIFPNRGSTTRTRLSLDVTASLLPSLLKLTDSSRASEGYRWWTGIRMTRTGCRMTAPAWEISQRRTWRIRRAWTMIINGFKSLRLLQLP